MTEGLQEGLSPSLGGHQALGEQSPVLPPQRQEVIRSRAGLQTPEIASAASFRNDLRAMQTGNCDNRWAPPGGRDSGTCCGSAHAGWGPRGPVRCLHRRMCCPIRRIWTEPVLGTTRCPPISPDLAHMLTSFTQRTSRGKGTQTKPRAAWPPQRALGLSCSCLRVRGPLRAAFQGRPLVLGVITRDPRFVTHPDL